MAQVVRDPASPEAGPGVTFYLDGAHTEESMASCGEWFHDAVQRAAALQPGRATQRVLLFNCMQVKRDLSSTCLHVPSASGSLMATTSPDVVSSICSVDGRRQQTSGFACSPIYLCVLAWDELSLGLLTAGLWTRALHQCMAHCVAAAALHHCASQL